MSGHHPQRCPICQLRPSARKASALELLDHFTRHGFHPTANTPIPARWIDGWARSDPGMEMAGTSARNHVEKRMRQIEALAQVDVFARDDMARLELDMAWRRWREGLTRTLQAAHAKGWTLSEEMPTHAELKTLLALHQHDTPLEKLSLAGALQDRFRESAPVSGEVLMEKILALWRFLPVRKPGGAWIFDERTPHPEVSWWRWTALRLFSSRLSHLPASQDLLPWLACASLPPANTLALLDDAWRSGWFAELAWPADPHLPALGKAWAAIPGRIASSLGAMHLEAHTHPPENTTPPTRL